MNARELKSRYGQNYKDLKRMFTDQQHSIHETICWDMHWGDGYLVGDMIFWQDNNSVGSAKISKEMVRFLKSVDFPSQ
jgi:hypothetical protein